MQRALDGLGEILRRRQPGETQVTPWEAPTEALGEKPSGYVKIAKMAIEIVDFPIENCDFPIVM